MNEPNIELLYRQGGELRSIIDPRPFRPQTPVVLLWNPKYPHNVGAALRACSCYGAVELWYTGERVSMIGDGKEYRLPREERMRGYREVRLVQYDRPFDLMPDVVPVCVEVSKNAERLFDFVHPDNAMYVFGPEDGNVPQMVRGHCHRFVTIPTRFCMNLAAAVYTVLYDRSLKEAA